MKAMYSTLIEVRWRSFFLFFSFSCLLLLHQIETNDFKFCFCLRKSIYVYVCVVYACSSPYCLGFVFLYFILFGNINRVFDFCDSDYDSLPFVALLKSKSMYDYMNVCLCVCEREFRNFSSSS